MTNRELLEVLARTKTAKRLEEARNAPLRVEPPPPPPKVIDWKDRRMKKNKIFCQYLSFVGIITVAAVLMFIIPLWAVYPPYGKAAMLAFPPILAMALSWMAAAWWAWDKERHIFFGVTVCATPLRLGIGLMWAAMAFQIPGVDTMALIMTMMFFWIAYIVPELGMIVAMSNKLEATSQIEPPNLDDERL